MNISQFFNKKPSVHLGLDIGNNSLKIIEIASRKDSFEIVNAGIKSLCEDADSVKEIKHFFKELNIQSKEVNLSISGDDVVARYISLPKMTEAELKKAMDFELEDHIPFKASEVYVDYTLLGEDANTKNRIMVFLVATKKETLDKRVKIVQDAGLKAKLVTMDALALKNCFYFNYPEKENANAALLNIGEKTTNLIITRKRIPYFVRDTHFGGNTITCLLQTKMETDKAKAEEFKRNLKDAPIEVTRTVKAAFANLLNEIFVSLDFYENLTEHKIEVVYISGGSSQLAGLKEFLSGYLGVEIIDISPFKNFTISPKIPKEILSDKSPYFSISCGLALEGLI